MMETGTVILESMLSELDKMGLSAMAQTLNRLYHGLSFLEMDPLSILREVVDAEYHTKSGKKFVIRLKKANLSGSPCRIGSCIDSAECEYLPEDITTALANLSFVEQGLNVCILGPSDSGKSYLAKALAIQACHNYRVTSFHCSAFTEEMAAIKTRDFEKYKRKMRYYMKLDVLVLDDLLLHKICIIYLENSYNSAIISLQMPLNSTEVFICF